MNAGDLILIRLERKTERRQFEIAASGLWRVSSGISITHQVQLFRSEEKPGVFKLAPAGRLTKGEYALYLTRGEGLSAYVYDFSVDRENETKSTGQAESIPRVASLTNSEGRLANDPVAAQESASPPASALPQLKARPSTSSSALTSVMPSPDGSVEPSNSSGESFEKHR